MNETNNEQIEHGGSARAMHRDERRRSLVLAAYQLIANKGFEQLRTRDVAAHVGVNIATLHYYFATKEDLIQAVVDYLLFEFSTSFSNDSGNLELDDTTPSGQVRAMFLITHRRFQAKPEMFIVLSELVLRSLRDTSLKSMLRRLDASWSAYLQYLIADGIQQGAFRAELNPKHIATELVMLIKGFFFHQITSPENADVDQLLKVVERLLLP